MADRYVSEYLVISSRLLRNLQIKNLVSLAHTLPSVDKVSVNFSPLKTVIKANGLTVPGQEVESNVNTNGSSLIELVS
jgi:hypothetical protein